MQRIKVPKRKLLVQVCFSCMWFHYLQVFHSFLCLCSRQVRCLCSVNIRLPETCWLAGWFCSNLFLSSLLGGAPCPAGAMQRLNLPLTARLCSVNDVRCGAADRNRLTGQRSVTLMLSAETTLPELQQPQHGQVVLMTFIK